MPGGIPYVLRAAVTTGVAPAGGTKVTLPFFIHYLKVRVADCTSRKRITWRIKIMWRFLSQGQIFLMANGLALLLLPLVIMPICGCVELVGHRT